MHIKFFDNTLYREVNIGTQLAHQSKIKACKADLFHICLALVTLLLISPLLALIYLLLRVSGVRRPIFRQTRVGKHGRHFTLYKFRTMFEAIATERPFICTDYNDDRITKIGRVLRRHKFDELLQLINVVKGDMHLVGPRPEIPHFHQVNLQTVPLWSKRLAVKPGITGIAQISRIVSHDPAKKIVLDQMYIRAKSVRNDLYIICKTCYLLLKGKAL